MSSPPRRSILPTRYSVNNRDGLLAPPPSRPGDVSSTTSSDGREEANERQQPRLDDDGDDAPKTVVHRETPAAAAAAAAAGAAPPQSSAAISLASSLTAVPPSVLAAVTADGSPTNADRDAKVEGDGDGDGARTTPPTGRSAAKPQTHHLPADHGNVTTTSLGVGTLTTGGGTASTKNDLADGDGDAGARGRDVDREQAGEEEEEEEEEELLPLTDVSFARRSVSIATPSPPNDESSQQQQQQSSSSPPPPPFFDPTQPSPHGPLRITCYGSSSTTTPLPYLAAATRLGQVLAHRGHTCVNGAGSAGCMAAMNDGAAEEGGHIVGVIHEMFVVDGGDWGTKGTGSSTSTSSKTDWVKEEGGAHAVFHNGQREILVAGGNDLQERKRLLVQGADALIVLPGGMGTWDELWEMACSRNLGFTDLPIVCVNVDGYYDPFVAMLDRAYRDGLVKKPSRPGDGEVVHFEPDSVSAVRWIEEEVERTRRRTMEREKAAVKEEGAEGKKRAYRRMDSALTVDRPGGTSNGRGIRDYSSLLWRSLLSARSRSRSWVGGKLVECDGGDDAWSEWATTAAAFVLTFAAGMAAGTAVATRRSTR